jgi:hypothetical protein
MRGRDGRDGGDAKRRPVADYLIHPVAFEERLPEREPERRLGNGPDRAEPVNHDTGPIDRAHDATPFEARAIEEADPVTGDEAKDVTQVMRFVGRQSYEAGRAGVGE